MAKYRLENNNHKVDCELLNESNGQYIVKFRSGVIRSVDKDRVSDFDRIDEGVLDAIGAGNEKVGVVANKYGRKIADTAKRAYNAVVDFFVKVFVKGNQIVFGDPETNMVLPAVTPATTMLNRELIGNKGVNFIPGTAVIEVAKEAGISPSAFMGFEFDNAPFDADEYIDQYTVRVDEGFKSPDVFDALFEARFTAKEGEGKWLGKGQKVTLESPKSETGKKAFPDQTLDGIVTHILKEYNARYNKRDYKKAPMLIFGAPGIGKTAIIKAIKKEIEATITGGEEISLYSIDAASISADSFTMPTKVDVDADEDKFFGDSADSSNYKPKNGGHVEAPKLTRSSRLFSRKKIMDMPKTWLPVYDSVGATDEEKYYLNILANGGELKQNKITHEIEVIKEGLGGIIFIDEYTRMSFEGKQVFMGAPIDRKCGNGLEFGSRWVFIGAANRKADMSELGRQKAIDVEPATRTRWTYINYVPDPKQWIEWAKSKPKDRPEATNVMPEIIEYIEHSIIENPKYGDYYELFKSETDEPDLDYAYVESAATPRGWKGVSDDLNEELILHEQITGNKVSLREYLHAMSEKDFKALRVNLVGAIGEAPTVRFLDYIMKVVLSSNDVDNVTYHLPGIGTGSIPENNTADRIEFLQGRLLDTRDGVLNDGKTMIPCVDEGALDAKSVKDPKTQDHKNIIEAIKESQCFRNIVNSRTDVLTKANNIISMYYFIALLCSKLNSNAGFDAGCYDMLCSSFEKEISFDPTKEQIDDDMNNALVSKSTFKATYA